MDASKIFKNLKNILTADCEVIKLKDSQYVFPIFKNGRSSLTQYAEKNNLKVFKNKEILNLKKIKVFLRSPRDRFVSGVHTFFYQNHNGLINKKILKKIENFDIVDRHFMPQYIWLLHLHRYFKGEIKIKNVTQLYDMIPNRDGPWLNNPKPWKKITKNQKKKILSIQHKKYIQVDEKIISKYLNQSVNLSKIVEEFKIYALS